MAAHALRLPMGLAPLIAEAKQRMLRRRMLAGLAIALAALGVGLAFTVRASGPERGASGALGSSVRAGYVRISVPDGFSRYPLRGGFGTRNGHFPVIGYIVTDLRLPAGVAGADLQRQWFAKGGAGLPANGVFLEVELWLGIGPCCTDNLRLPLTPSQAWYTPPGLGTRAGFFGFHNDQRSQDYEVTYWSGPDAPRKDQAALIRALESIRPAR